ncbi:xanthine dehydrogenase 1-like [Eucalyptus grandis]|uniref:xanthine dehydrogenase 1-like n=1 Tax=Eucalyptus grandis TaxID=71139 RepID=UPI00192EA403|nr:xanthine dehydrogenase 1-like [Eucalyptus grandis]
MRVFLEKKDDDLVVADASIVYGGVAPLSIAARQTKEYLIGKTWNQELLQGAQEVSRSDIIIKEDGPGGMVEFRKSLTLSFFFKFFYWVSQEMDEMRSIREEIPLSHISAIKPFERPSAVGSQDCEIVKQGTFVGSPEIHLSSRLQVTVEAEYADDTPLPPDGLNAVLLG